MTRPDSNPGLVLAAAVAALLLLWLISEWLFQDSSVSPSSAPTMADGGVVPTVGGPVPASPDRGRAHLRPLVVVSETPPPPSVSPAGKQAATTSGPTDGLTVLADEPQWVQDWAVCVADHESINAGNYQAQNPTSTASGRSQFLDSTFEAVTGLPGSASDYPPVVQDNAFATAFDRGAGASNWDGTGC